MSKANYKPIKEKVEVEPEEKNGYIRDFIKPFSSAGRGFGTPSVMQYVGIAKFDLQKELHQRLAEISKKCHQLKLEDKEKEVEELEKENDELVSQLLF